MARVKGQLEARITRLFAESGAHLEERPLLPSMGMLLAAAAGDADATEQVSKEALDLFGRKLAGLLPVGFTPEGTGLLRVLVTHPRVQAVEEVQEYLGKTLRLPTDAKNSVEYRGVESDSVTVVLFRSEMSLTQVPEARKVLRQWARAKDSEQAQDVLRWRQRLGFRDSWMVSSEEDRRVIMHRLLCCMWNGQVDVVDGDPASPERVRLRLFPEKGAHVPGVRLRLGDYPGGVSSWAELLRAYERWTVLDDERTVEDYCRELMGAQPSGLARTGSEPHPLFTDLVEKIAPRQLELLADRREQGGERVEGWVRPLWEFWAETLPAALDTEFGDQRAVQPTLRTLLEHVRGGTPTRPRTPDGLAEPRRRPQDDDFGTAPVDSFDSRDTYRRDDGDRDENADDRDSRSGGGTATTTRRTAASGGVKSRTRTGTSGVSLATVVAARAVTSTRPAGTTAGTTGIATDRVLGGGSVARSTAPGPLPGTGTTCLHRHGTTTPPGAAAPGTVTCCERAAGLRCRHPSRPAGRGGSAAQPVGAAGPGRPGSWAGPGCPNPTIRCSWWSTPRPG